MVKDVATYAPKKCELLILIFNFYFLTSFYPKKGVLMMILNFEHFEPQQTVSKMFFYNLVCENIHFD